MQLLQSNPYCVLIGYNLVGGTEAADRSSIKLHGKIIDVLALYA